MSPVDKVALTGALLAAAKRLDDQARDEFVAWAQMNRGRTFDPVVGGTISVARKKRQITFNAEDFEDWVREHQPYNIETIERVRPAAATALKARLRIDGDVVLWLDEHGVPTGEVCEFATATPEGEPYASWRGGDPIKDDATAWLTAKFDHVAALMLPELKAVEQ